MKIPRRLPQFNDNPTMFMVASDHGAVFYLAFQGEIKKVDSFKVAKPQYSDREDFARRGSIIFESGALFEKEKKLILAGFETELKQRLPTLLERYRCKQIWIFSPPQLLKKIISHISPTPRRQVVKKISPNVTSEEIF